jgi:cytoskeletal protein CcmA (bactofilin family)
MAYFFFYLGLLLWLFTLLAWILFQPYLAGTLAILSAGAFILQGTKRIPSLMFGKNMTKKDNVTLQSAASVDPTQGTVIAQGVIFEGNITTTGQVFIYGQVKGNIQAKDGQITVMREGLVTGNVASPVLVVDGTVDGECCAESVEVCERGRIGGRLRYATLSVAQGGVVVGQLAHCEDMQASNVIDFSHDQQDSQTVASA